MLRAPALGILFLALVPTSASPFLQDQSDAASAEIELRTATELTRKGRFADAIPHFLAADGRVSASDENALHFNLALCYVGTSQFGKAIQTIEQLKSSGVDNDGVENLLAQSYIGNGQNREAFRAVQRAASFAPKNEKLYTLVSDACMDRKDFALGLQVVDLGLQHLPKSARLHYQRAYFLVVLDQWDSAQSEFDLAARLAPHSEIAYLAQVQKFKYAGDLTGQVRVGREAVQEGQANFQVLAILGDALIASGAVPGQPEFTEAEAVLTKAVEERPQFAGAQLSLGSLLLQENRIDAAIQRLEIARSLDPANVTVYSRLAVAYRRVGRKEAADQALATLADLNSRLEKEIRSAPGDRKAIMGGGESSPHP